MYEKPTILQHTYKYTKIKYTHRVRETKTKYLQMCTVIQMYHDFFSCVYTIYTSVHLVTRRVRFNRAYLRDFIECLFACFMSFRDVFGFTWKPNIYVFYIYSIWIELRRKEKKAHTFFCGSSKVTTLFIYYHHSYGFSLVCLLFFTPPPPPLPSLF